MSALRVLAMQVTVFDSKPGSAKRAKFLLRPGADDVGHLPVPREAVLHALGEHGVELEVQRVDVRLGGGDERLALLGALRMASRSK